MKNSMMKNTLWRSEKCTTLPHNIEFLSKQDSIFSLSALLTRLCSLMAVSFLLLFGGCEYNLPLKDYIRYHLTLVPVDSFDELQPAVDDAPSGSTIALRQGFFMNGPIMISGKTLTLSTFNGADVTLMRNSGNPDEFFNVSSGSLILGDSYSGGLVLDGGQGSGYTADKALVVGGTESTIIVNNGVTLRNNDNQGGYSDGKGGAVHMDGNNNVFKMTGGTITLNSTDTSQDGGGVYISGTDSTFEMTGGTISYNTAGGSGGGVYIDSGAFTIHDGAIISHNTAAGASGGGVYVYGAFTMHGGEINQNIHNTGSSSAFGGGVSMSGGNFIMYGGSISGNVNTSSAAIKGGGLYMNSGDFTMYGGSISQNKSTSTSGVAQGGGVHISGAGNVVAMHGGDISGNDVKGAVGTSHTDGSFGGGIYMLGANSFTKAPFGDSTTSGTINGGTEPEAPNRVLQYHLYVEVLLQSNKGHAVYLDSPPRKRETTAGPSVTLDSAISGADGGWN
jgi:hypothetical protein